METTLTIRSSAPILSIAALVIGAASPVFAQSSDGPAPPPWYEQIAVHAFASAGYSYNFNRPPSGTNAFHVFDFDDNTFKIDIVQLELEHRPDKAGDLGFRCDFTAGASIPPVVAASGLFRDPQTGVGQDFDLQRAYVSYIVPVGSGLHIDFGKFTTALGYEVIDGWDGYNDNATRSFLFGYAVPFTHTGLRLAYSFNPKLSAMASVVNGWDNVKDNNSAKSVHAQLGWLPAKGASVSLNVISGAEQNDNNHNIRTVFDLASTVTLAAATSLGFNVDYGWEQGAGPSGGTATWKGAAAYLRHRFSDRFALILRTEVFADVDGTRTGVAQTLGEITLTPELHLSPKAILRADLRLDHSDQHVFPTPNGSVTRQPTVLINASYVF